MRKLVLSQNDEEKKYNIWSICEVLPKSGIYYINISPGRVVRCEHNQVSNFEITIAEKIKKKHNKK